MEIQITSTRQSPVVTAQYATTATPPAPMWFVILRFVLFQDAPHRYYYHHQENVQAAPLIPTSPNAHAPCAIPGPRGETCQRGLQKKKNEVFLLFFCGSRTPLGD